MAGCSASRYDEQAIARRLTISVRAKESRESSRPRFLTLIISGVDFRRKRRR